MRVRYLVAALLLASCGGRPVLRAGSDAAVERSNQPDLWRDNLSPGRHDLRCDLRRDLDPSTPTCSGDRDCDGTPDPSDCAPEDPLIGPCRDFYLDADGDGFGSAKACRCEPGDGYTALTGGDCYDSGPRASLVHPGQKTYYEEPRGDGSFDYDCDGKQTREYGIYSCTAHPYPSQGCTTESGYQFEIGCGLMAQFVYACFFQWPMKCEPGIQLRSQRCR